MSLMSSAHIKEEELLTKILHLEGIQQNREIHFRKISTNDKSSKVYSTEDSSSTYNVIRLSGPRDFQRNAKDGDRKVRCFNYQITGHISRNCTAPRRPIKCV